MDLRQVFKRYGNVFESFTRKIRSKKNDELTAKADTAFVPDGVYILHETLGVRGVEGWNPKFNKGVVGVLVVEDDHKIVVALEDAPENLPWSSEYGLINQPVDFDEEEDAQNDFNGEYYCQKLDSPKFPAAYYCKTYNKGGRSWYLPSSGELRLICNHFKEIQNALSIVGGQKLVATWGKDVPEYLSSTESSPGTVWALDFSDDYLDGYDKVSDIGKVRPVSKFGPSNTLKESFTRKISSRKNPELISKTVETFIPDGVYILHETLGVNGVEGWNPKNNNGVVGILLIEDDHKIVVATEDAPEVLPWSNEYGLINQPVDELEDAKSDFNGEMYCRKLDSPDFPAAYYCKTYNKGNRDWYLPSSGELWLIYNHLEEIQNALETVGGQKLITTWDEGDPVYWSSTEVCDTYFWRLLLLDGDLGWTFKVGNRHKVRPFSKFGPSNTLKESFTRKIRSKKNDELTTKPSFELDNGVYILHETLGVKSVEGWNPKNNDGVIGILLIEDDHNIVVATEDSPENLTWSKKRGLINQPVDFFSEDAKSDFNGEYYCRKLDSPDFPAAYYCKTYNKGNRDWYLPSTGELWLIYSHFDEIQNALSIVGGQKFVITWDEGLPCYWSSTEDSAAYAWDLDLCYGTLSIGGNKVIGIGKVRPVSKFGPSTLKESFTRKIRSKKNDELVTKADTAFIPNGVYILHETLGVNGVEGWNPKNNNGVVGILLIEDDHKIVVATEEEEDLPWSNEYGLINQPVDELEDAKSDFNGEYYCRRLDSPDFPAAYYCKTYNKGGRSWYLPSSGELWLIYSHFDEIQNALSIVGGQKFDTTWVESDPVYWSSTENSARYAWNLYLNDGYGTGGNKVSNRYKVRPVSNFRKKNTLRESFTKKISSKKNTDLISKPSFVLEDGVYILHETLGVRDVEGWNPKFNKGVVGILLVEDDHKIVVALEDSPKNLIWSEKRGLVNHPFENRGEAKSDFNGEEHCIKFNSPDFPAAYYCLNYNKGGRDWYLPSSGELWLIYRHLEEIQTALSIVRGQKFVTTWDDEAPCYWSSTEYSATRAWHLFLHNGNLCNWYDRVNVAYSCKVRPVSKFDFSTLKESFTRKIRSKKNDELVTKADTVFVPDGVYILHETLGVKTLEKWSKKLNNGVVGILLVEDDHQIVVATEDSPEKLTWSKKLKLVNEPVDKLKDAESDFNGEEYCIKLNSPDFPAAYYCLNYKKGGRNWHLPSSGELWLIYNHLEEIQNALETVGGQKFVTTFNNGVPCYWSSTEYSVKSTLHLPFDYGHLVHRNNKISTILKVRPVSNFNLSELKESFTKKISKKNSTEVIGKSERMFLEESIAQMVYSFGKYDAVPDIDKKYILGYKLPFGCLPEFFEGNSNKVLDNGDVVKRTETRSLMGYTQTYEIIASHIYFNSSRKKVYVGMYRPSPLNQSESSPKIYNLYGAASSGILELSEFSIDELRQILQNLQERTKMKKPLRKKIVLKSEENY